jgi:hypothetical protein
MDIKIKVNIEFNISERSLEDAFEEYDELSVSGLLREVLDKAIACDNIKSEVIEGPNTLEEYDELKKQQQS